MLAAYYADFFEKHPNDQLDETDDFDEELIAMARAAGVSPEDWEDI
jgi:hypothetical protein